MCRSLSKFDRLLVECFMNNRFPNLDGNDFNTILFTEDGLLNNWGERIFVYIPIIDERKVEILFRPIDGEMIDERKLENLLYLPYSEGDCAGYDLSCIDDGQVEIYFNNHHDYGDQLELIALFEESVAGDVRSPEDD